MMTWLLTLSLAHAAGSHVVVAGETVESIARSLGDVGLADDLREQNGLLDGAQPSIGTVLTLPSTVRGSGCEPSRVVEHQGPLYLRTAADSTPAPTSAPALDRESASGLTPISGRRVLNLGDEICTGAAGVDGETADGFARVELSVPPAAGARDVITLLPGTCVTITAVDRVRNARTSLVDLTRGAIVVEHQPVPGDVIVRTGGADPAGSAVTYGRRGGFRVAVEPDAARTEAIGADVSTTAQGVEVMLAEGFGGRTTFGEAPGDPHALPLAPRLVLPADRSALVVPEFRALPSLRATTYVLRVALAEAADLPVFALELLTPRYAPLYPDETLALPSGSGAWSWSMTAVDAYGFEGKPSSARTFFAPAVSP